MKYIIKNGTPPNYADWCRIAHECNYEDFRRLQNPEKAMLRQELLKEQGWIYAYTMQRIDENNSHIEHIKPQSLCREDQIGSDLDYNNLVACFPVDGMSSEGQYGAQKKANWWKNDGTEFISPLNPACESFFHFDLNGNITPARADKAAITTIKVLALDHPILIGDRKGVITEFIFRSGSDSLSKPEAIKLMRTICNRDKEGRYHTYCTIIRDALHEYLKILEKLPYEKTLGGEESE